MLYLISLSVHVHVFRITFHIHLYVQQIKANINEYCKHILQVKHKRSFAFNHSILFTQNTYIITGNNEYCL